MTSALESILDKWNLNNLFENVKDKMVEAVWYYIDGFELINDTEPTPEILRKFIQLTMQYLPEIVKFRIDADSPQELKNEVLNYLTDKVYRYALQKLVEMKRLSIQP